MRFIFKFWAACFLSLFFFSCADGIFTEEKILVSFPNWDDYSDRYGVPPNKFWKVAVCKEDGIEWNAVYENEMLVCVKKNRPFCVLAWPMCMNSEGMFIDFFRPIGALYSDVNESGVELSWSSGFSAYVMMLVLQNAGFSKDGVLCVSRFNWLRFEEILEKNSLNLEEGDYCYNPWNLDLESIISSIAHNSFRVSLLNLGKLLYVEEDGYRDFFSSYMPENEFLQKKGRICLKQSEVNLISDYNLKGIILYGKSEKNLSVKYISLPIFKTEYE